MVSHISYYFTLFKKFQVLNHVPSQTVHGSSAPTGGFDLKNPNSPFVALISSPTKKPLTLGDYAPANNPLWAILNTKATSTAATVTIPGGVQGGSVWSAMPLSATTGWKEFQIGPPVPLAGFAIVDVFGRWISIDNQVVDIPAGVLATVPSGFTGTDAGVVPFVCSKPGDQGARPDPLPNFWATSLIFLVDPNTGTTITPPTLVPGAEHYVAAVIGNRGNTDGGRYLGQPNALQAAAVVMVFGTTVSPGVRLPALSNMDLNDINPINETYFLRSGQYDVIGFRLNVQTVFDGLVAAVNQAANIDGTLNIGSATPEQWVKTPPSHLCVKVVTRVQGDQFPTIDTYPQDDARIAQKNLAPFDATISDTGNPHIDWTTFVAGQPLALIIKGAGKNKFTLLNKLPRGQFEIFVAMPEKIHEQFVLRTKAEIRGFKQVNAKEILATEHGNKPLPFARDAVILQAAGDENSFEFGPMPDGHAAGMALGFRYVPSKLKHGTTGDVTLVHEAVVPRLDLGSGCYKVENKTVGGFTLQVRALDPHIDPKGRRIEFGDN
jgi:hypothetical protein